MRRRRVLITAMTIALLAAVGPPARSAPPPIPARPAATVTLVTGDKVLLRGTTKPVVEAGPGRAGMPFQIYRDHGDTYVVPADAAALVSAGTLDRRLFDVTALDKAGYGDSDRTDLPLIVSGPAAQLKAAKARVLPSLDAVAVRTEKTQTGGFWRSVRGTATTTLAAGVTKVWLDGKVEASLDHSVPQIGAPAAWQAGHTGAGTEVAILDTGIDAGHPDLADAIESAADFTGGETGTDDRIGHGTHVASIITGSGADSGGRYRGVAPDTRLLVGKVLDDDGFGLESWIIAGMEWAVAQGADVVNLSLGSGMPGDGTDPQEQAIDRLSAEHGTLFVVAAGNEGPEGPVSSPAAADAALAVGAVDRDDRLADFSSRGPRWNDGAIKPDLTAPGVGIVAARAANGVIGEPVDDHYVRLSGTSMAAPHVAGAAALLAGEHPGWNGARLKAALMATAQPTDGLTVFEQGAGRVDLARATRQQVFAATASLSLGTARWPHADDKPITRTVAYDNDSDQPVTLALSTDVRTPDGRPAPTGMFRAEPASLTVPAHGRATARLVADTRIAGPDGWYSGVLVATAGADRLRTPVAVEREVESYDVTVNYLDRDGHPAAPSYRRFVSIERPEANLSDHPTPTEIVRLPKGTYYFEGFSFEVVGEEPFSYRDTLFYEPAVTVSADTSLTIDGRRAVPAGFRTDRPDAVRRGLEFTSLRDTDWGGRESTGGWYGGTTSGDTMVDTAVLPSRTSAPGRYHFDVEGTLARRFGTPSPYLYHLKWTQEGKVPANLNRRVHDRDLATVRTRFATQDPAGVVVKDLVAETNTPGTITERYSPGFTFAPAFVDGTDWYLYGTHPRRYSAAGTQPAERWNVGPFVPRTDPERPPTREGDVLAGVVEMHGDQFRDHVGQAADTGSSRLLRDGVEITAVPYSGSLYAEVPTGAATYRLETESVRTDSAFSTRQTAAWTFRSGHVEGIRVLPLLLPRYTPVLDDLNRAPAGRRFEVPVAIDVPPGIRTGRVSVAVEVSYDDGATWHRAAMTGPDRHTAVLRHPAKPGFVSLRTTASDAAGHRVEHTLIHAYRTY